VPPRLQRTRPLARLRNGRTDWYRIENSADGGSTARVRIYDEIGWFGITAESFARELDDITASTIELHLNSPGGDVFDAVTIYNALRNHPARVVTTIDGLAASAVSYIAMAGDEVVTEKTGTMMIHDAISWEYGNAADMRTTADLLDKLSETIAGIYADRSGRKVADMRALMQAETWFNADEALAAGLVDRIAGQAPADDESESDAVTDKWDLSVYNYAGRDQAPAPVIPAPTSAAPVATASAPLTPAPWPFDREAFRNLIEEAVR
jgi:ATP-dependent protease ClpP protease subunit